MLRRLLVYLLATVVTAVLATIASTQFVLARLGALGVEIGVAVRLDATLHDLVGMGPTFAALVAAGFIVALPVAALLTRFAGRARSTLYTIAGATAIATILIAMKLSFGLTPIAAARSVAGFVTLAACGAVGGWLFARLSGTAAGGSHA